MKIWRTRIVFWILKATNTHSGCVILIAFPLQQFWHKCYVIVHYSSCYIFSPANEPFGLGNASTTNKIIIFIIGNSVDCFNLVCWIKGTQLDVLLKLYNGRIWLTRARVPTVTIPWVPWKAGYFLSIWTSTTFSRLTLLLGLKLLFSLR